MNYIKFVRIFLLILIIIGIGLLLTQKMWVPKVVDMILKMDSKAGQVSVDIKPDSFDWCIANGGQNQTPNYNAPKVCILENKVYKENCVGNDKYFVISKDKTDEVWSDILIKYKSSPSQIISCQYSKGSGDFEVAGDAMYVLALENNFLIIDSGTGPDPRGLTVYDLNTRKKVFEDSYSSPVDIQNNVINYWTDSTKTATEKNCPDLKEWQADGLGAAIDAHVSLNISTLTKTDLGEYRCSARQ
jgi:hypothetical protein